MPSSLFSPGKITTLLKTLWPRHLLADLAQRLVESRTPWVKNAVIRYFLLQHSVDLHEAELANPYDYPSFNALFSRALKPGSRTICAEPAALASPVDGSVSEYGTLDVDRLLQAKGRAYSVQALLATAWSRNTQLLNGTYLTLYLAPGDYHRVHMPLAGRLVYTTYVPGSLFSVNQHSVQHVDQLFARNERLICEFATDYGRFVLVLVGAGFVSGIETAWGGLVPRKSRAFQQQDYEKQNLRFAKGEELARFRMGSTVLILLPEGCARWHPQLATTPTVRMGEKLATLQASVISD